IGTPLRGGYPSGALTAMNYLPSPSRAGVPVRFGSPAGLAPTSALLASVRHDAVDHTEARNAAWRAWGRKLLLRFHLLQFGQHPHQGAQGHRLDQVAVEPRVMGM